MIQNITFYYRLKRTFNPLSCNFSPLFKKMAKVTPYAYLLLLQNLNYDLVKPMCHATSVKKSSAVYFLNLKKCKCHKCICRIKIIKKNKKRKGKN